MNEKQDLSDDEIRRAEPLEAGSTCGGETADIGIGKKVGFYGCGFMILAMILVFIVLAWTGFNVPFQDTEGVGP